MEAFSATRSPPKIKVNRLLDNAKVMGPYIPGHMWGACWPCLAPMCLSCDLLSACRLQGCGGGCCRDMAQRTCSCREVTAPKQLGLGQTELSVLAGVRLRCISLYAPAVDCNRREWMGLRLAHPPLCTVLALETASDFLLCLLCALAASDCTPCFACAVSTMSCDAHKGAAPCCCLLQKAAPFSAWKVRRSWGTAPKRAQHLAHRAPLLYVSSGDEPRHQPV